MFPGQQIGKAREFYEEYTLAEKGSICPLIGGECVKDPQKCRWWQPFLISDVHPTLHTVTQKEVYLCVNDILRLMMNNILLFQTGQIMVKGPGMPG